MRSFTLPLYAPEEYPRHAPGGILPFLAAYLHEDGEARPAVVVVPGGAYCFVSAGEAEPVARAFYERGYQAFVAVYTTDPTSTKPLGAQPLNDVARAVRLVRRRAGEWRVLPDRVAVCGFSAGGHLAGCLAVNWASPLIDPAPDGVSCRPDAAVLGYPVVTMGEGTHPDTYRTLLGEAPSQEMRDVMSLEKQVRADTPPMFLWHTRDDEAVPVENSLLLEEALRAHGVVHEMHIFRTGVHGLSVATPEWSQGDWGLDTEATMRAAVCEAIEEGAQSVFPGWPVAQLGGIEGWQEKWAARSAEKRAIRRPDEAIALWPQMADLFLRGVWG